MTGSSGQRGEADTVDRAPRSARWLVAVLLAALFVPGLIGFEAWPLTAWRMFSLPRQDTATTWVLEGVAEDGSTRLVDLDELPMVYSNSEWRLRDVAGASREERDEICQVMAEAVADVDPAIVELRIARDSQELVEEDGEWGATHDLDVRHTCRTAGEGGA
jgi:hypothetical protein